MTDITSATIKQTIRRRRSSRKAPAIPYASATSGTKAREEIIKILRRLGCEAIGIMDDFAKHELLLAFTHRGSAGTTARLGQRMGADVSESASVELQPSPPERRI